MSSLDVGYGLSPEGWGLYRALARSGRLSAGEARLRFPASETTILELLRKGYARATRGPRGTDWEAVSLVTVSQRKATELLNILEAQATIAAAGGTSHMTINCMLVKDQSPVGVIHNFMTEAIRWRSDLSVLINQEGRSVLSLRRLVSSQIKLNLLIAVDLMRQLGSIDRLMLSSASDVTSRVLDRTPACALIRSDAALVWVSGPQASCQVWRVNDSSGLFVALGLFDIAWRFARPLFREEGRSSISEVESFLLELLASGARDDAIAQAMRLSIRTVRRHIAELERRCDVRGRFALALVAQRRGWL